MNELSKDAVSWLTVGEDAAGQRVDNFLGKVLKGVPKSHIYRILRSGEVRVNKGRVGPDARLALGDVGPRPAGAHGRAGASPPAAAALRAPVRRCRSCSRTTRSSRWTSRPAWRSMAAAASRKA